MTALLIVLALVALYVAWRIYSAPGPAKPSDTQPIPPPPDTFGEKFPDPKPLKTQTLEEWLEEHPEPPPSPAAVEISEPAEPTPFLAGKLLPPEPSHPRPPVLALPHVRKRKRKK